MRQAIKVEKAAVAKARPLQSGVWVSRVMPAARGATRRRGFSRLDVRAWERSNAVAAVRVPPSAVLRGHALALAGALEGGDRHGVETVSQRLIDAFCALLQVPSLHVEVCGVRPSNRHGELHGLYEPASRPSRRDRVRVWMYTARRRQVVAFKTFLRTLLHELCHHLDYELFKLGRSFHTEGFYKRESSLVYAVLPPLASAGAVGCIGGRERVERPDG